MSEAVTRAREDAPAHGLWMARKPDSRLGVHLTAVTGDGPYGEADAELIAAAPTLLAELADEVERLRALTTVDDAMVERSSLALHHITCDTAYHECVLDQSVGCRAVARAALEAALGVES